MRKDTGGPVSGDLENGQLEGFYHLGRARAFALPSCPSQTYRPLRDRDFIVLLTSGCSYVGSMSSRGSFEG